MTPGESSGRPERAGPGSGPGSGHLLTIVVDEWAAPPPPPDLEMNEMARRRSWQLDAMIAASITKPQSLCLITGV